MPPRDRVLASLGLLLALLLSLSCNPNPQPEALTPIPTLAPGATLTLIPSLEGAPATGGEAASTASPVGSEVVSGATPAAGDPARGAIVFGNCIPCHGENAQGGPIGPTLVGAEVKAKPDDYYRQTITNGIQGTAMAPWGGRLGPEEIEDVIAFLRSKQ